MSQNKRKVDRLEQQAAGVGRSGWLSVSQRWDGPPDVYYDAAGTSYTDADLARLEPTLEGIIRVVYVKDWRPLPGEQFIQLTWGDDDEA